MVFTHVSNRLHLQNSEKPPLLKTPLKTSKFRCNFSALSKLLKISWVGCFPRLLSANPLAFSAPDIPNLKTWNILLFARRKFGIFLKYFFSPIKIAISRSDISKLWEISKSWELFTAFRTSNCSSFWPPEIHYGFLMRLIDWLQTFL